VAVNRRTGNISERDDGMTRFLAFCVTVTVKATLKCPPASQVQMNGFLAFVLPEVNRSAAASAEGRLDQETRLSENDAGTTLEITNLALKNGERAFASFCC
jgi:hypothetical protein